MLGVRQTGGASPNTLLLGVVFFCVLVAVAAIAVAATPTWLGLRLSPPRETGLLVIRHVVPGGPAALAGARVGDSLIALGGPGDHPLELTADDVREDGGAVTQAGVRASMQRYDRVAQALKAAPLRLVLKDTQGQVRTIELQPRRRPLSTLRVEFWANLGFGLLAALICGWVWALRPGERATQLFALTGLSMLGFTTGWAVHSSVELAMDTALLMPALWVNYAGATAYGGAMIALFLCYPRQLVRGPVLLLVAPLLVVALFLSPYLPGNPPISKTGQSVTVIEMALIVVAIGLQLWATRGDPAARAVARWLGLSVILGAGAFISTVAVPASLGRPALIDPRFSLGFFVIIYVGMAIGLRRHRLFELDQWAFRILFYLGAGVALVALDAVLVVMLRATPEFSLGAALLLVAFVYLPLRDVLWRRLIARSPLKEHEMFAAVARVALTLQAEARADRWRELQQQIFEPLEIRAVVGAAPDQAAVAEIRADGVELIIPPAAGAPALSLRYPWRGRGLFGPSHLALAEQLATLLQKIEAGRDAYGRGVLEERLRIARDLHDDVGARLLTGLHGQDLTETHEAVRGAIFDLRTIVSGLTGKELMLSDVLGDLRHETSERLAAAGLELDWPLTHLGGPDILVSYRVYKNLTSACREIVSNAIRHARASSVTVSVRFTRERLDMTISDDGIGLRREPGGRRSGLRNLEQRIVELGGEIGFPQVGQGTQVQLSLPLEPASS
ncbi:MAG: ATP-binding protein [Polyangia bacterium]